MAKSINRHISHIKSSGTTAPSASDLLYGEIAVGYKVGEEKLYIKNSDGNVISFENSANVLAVAELYADSGDVTSVSGDSEISVTLSEKAATGRTLTVTHASGSAQSGFKKLESDAYGHITGGSAVELSDLTTLGAVANTVTVTGDGALSGGGALSSNQVITHNNNGALGAGTAQGSNGSVAFGGDIVIPSVTFDAYGHITASGSTTVTLPTESAAYISAVTATNKGIEASVTNATLTVGHINEGTAGSAKTSSTTVNVTPSGADIVVPEIAYDAYGHISGTGSTNVTLTVDSATSSVAGVVKIATTTGTNNTDTVMTQKAVTDELATKALAVSAITSADYDSTGKTINFFNAAGTKVGSIDATDFIKDGMVDDVVVDDVEISGETVTCLVVTFNTDAGKEAINIPLTDLFDPTNYYNKTEIDNLVGSGFTNTTITDTIVTNEQVTSAALNDLNTNKADKDHTHAISGVTGLQAALDGKSNTGHTHAISDVNNLQTTLDGKANTATTLTGYGITDAYTKEELTGSSTNVVVAKANSAATAASADSVALANVSDADDLKAIEALTGTSGLLKKTAANTWELDNTSYVSDVSLTGGTNNGTLKLTVNGTATDNIAVTGLGDAAYLNTGTTAGTVAAGDHTHSDYVNQNAFSNVKVGATTIEADSATDTVEFEATNTSGTEGLTISGDATNDKVTLNLGDIVCGDYA